MAFFSLYFAYCHPADGCFCHMCDDVLLPQCLSKEYGLSTLSLVIPILTKSLCGQHVCCQSDDCLLLKVYQGCLGDSVDLPHTNRISLQLKVVMLVENFMSSNNEALPYLAECFTALLKLLVCLLDKEVVFLQQFPLESLMNNPKASCSVLLLRRGIFLLASFVTYSNRLLADLRMLVGHKYNNLIISSLRLLNGLKDIPENEVLMDLLDFENIEDSEVLGEDGVEDMEVGE
ncbi:hypothetical protein QZH41_011767 [Actinostola sp. cb2023]|nr:hypothetical protein QZH41_011767 [Actinostola sp. cb2023]